MVVDVEVVDGNGRIATAIAEGPPGSEITPPVRFVSVFIGTIVSLPKQATQAVLPSGLMAMACGFFPT